MNLILFAFIILISFPTILAFADSEDDTTLLNDKGVESLQLGKTEEAISYFDKALEIDPNYLDALNNKGTMLNRQGKYFEATSYFNKVLTIEPDHELAKSKLDNTKLKLPYKEIDGMMELKVRDAQGRLVAYEKSTKFLVLEDEAANNFIADKFNKKVITRNGQDVEVFQFKRIQNMDQDQISSQWGIRTSSHPGIWLLYGKFSQCPIQKGDVAEVVYTFFSLPE